MNYKSSIFNKVKNEAARVNHNEQDAADKVAKELFALMPTSLSNRPIVFVCIGTDRSTGDSLGPLIGTLLQERAPQSFHVYGTLENPIHALNLAEKLTEIKTKHLNPFIIGIDACLGRLKSVGVIQIGSGPVKPGSGVNKDLPAVGDIHITGIVNVSGFMEYFVLQNTRLHLVMEMARTIADGIYHTSKLYEPSYFSKLKWQIGQEQEQTP
ncbi:spore protease YyaC [Bacillus tuaregi]|uniref:spore protease YyaC n=1 Tax=Bacillus tuaregi TaxID=1816695 RepID=UPI0008F8EE03|nr:spore protease YyaC [Bacillus tuaregi]